MNIFQAIELSNISFIKSYTGNDVDEQGNTPLIFATYREKEFIIRLLLPKSDINAKNNHGMNAIRIAGVRNNFHLVKLFIRNMSQKSIFNEFKIISVANKVCVYNEAFKILDKKYISDSGTSLLQIALINNFPFATVKKLLKVGLDPNIGSDFSPLHLAASKGDLLLCRLLIENGANPNATDKNGFFPLHAAVKNGHEGLMLVLAMETPEFNESTVFGTKYQGVKTVDNFC